MPRPSQTLSTSPAASSARGDRGAAQHCLKPKREFPGNMFVGNIQRDAEDGCQKHHCPVRMASPKNFQQTIQHASHGPAYQMQHLAFSDMGRLRGCQQSRHIRSQILRQF